MVDCKLRQIHNGEVNKLMGETKNKEINYRQFFIMPKTYVHEVLLISKADSLKENSH